MCGIVGFVNNKGRSVSRDVVEAMNGAIVHRGPDDDGFYVRENVALAMRRLSIIDLASGKQPIHNADKTKWIVFNGEIYNYRELREDLEKRGHKFVRYADDCNIYVRSERAGQRVGALVHDRAALEEPAMLDAVCAAAGLALENHRLHAEVLTRLEEVRASRARIVEAGDAARRRVERNLHDGAQQRLVALSLTMRLAQGRLRKDPEGAEGLLAGAQDELGRALEELRELARGIHPAVLSDRGLKAALEALAGRSPVPVDLDGTPPDQLPPSVEAAAYFVVAEALTNVVKYAHASQARVSVSRSNGHAIVEITDDGVGGADPDRGSGLRGLADRISALDGTLELSSPEGAGTLLRAEIPV